MTDWSCWSCLVVRKKWDEKEKIGNSGKWAKKTIGDQQMERSNIPIFIGK